MNISSLKILLFLVLLSLSNSIYSQDRDTIYYNSLVIYSQDNLDSLLYRSTDLFPNSELRKILQASPDLKGWVNYHSHLSQILYDSDENDLAISHADSAINIFQNATKKRNIEEDELKRAYYVKGKVLINKKQYRSAINNLHMAIELAKKYDYKWISYYQTSIARTHHAIGNDSIALSYYLEASRDTNSMKIPRFAIATLNRIGLLYFNSGDNKLAKKYYQQSIKISETSYYKKNLTASYGNLAFVYNLEKKSDSAYQYFKKAYLANEEYGINSYDNALPYDQVYRNYVAIYENKTVNAIASLKSIMDTIENRSVLNKDDKFLMLGVSNVLSYGYEKKQDLRGLKNLNARIIGFLNRFQVEQSKQDISNLEIEYQTREKDISIGKLQENKEQQEIIIEQQRYIVLTAVAVVIMFVIFILYIIKQRKLKALYEKENLEQRLLRSQMNPHFVSNSLASIGALVESNSDETIPYINNLAALFRQTLEYSREEFVGLDEELSLLKNYLNLQSSFSKKFDFEIIADASLDFEGIIIPPMLMQPFIENAILHGIAKSENRGRIMVNIKLLESEKLLHCSIDDNGVGFDETAKLNRNSKQKSVSGNIVKSRLETIKKKFKVDARFLIKKGDNTGTHVDLFIPFFYDE